MFYNNGIKLEFQKQLEKAGMSDNYNRSFSALFTVSKEIEEGLDKDLYDFNIEETEAFLKSFRSTSKQSMNTRLSTIVMYRKWAFQKKLTQNILITKAIEEFNSENLVNITAEKEKYVTKEEIYTGSLELENSRDALVLVLLWWGIKGDGFKEICELANGNIQRISRKIILPNRTVTVDDFTMDLILETINTKTYMTMGKGGAIYERKLVDNNYIIRKIPSKHWGGEQDPISKQTILRIVAFSKNVLGKDYINATNIYKSGQFYRFINGYPDEIKKIVSDKGKIALSTPMNFLKKETGESVTPGYASVFLTECKKYIVNNVSKEEIKNNL